MNSKKRIVLRFNTRKSATKAIRQAEAALMVSTLKDTPLVTIKERVPDNRAIQSLSSEEYNKYVNRLAQTTKLLAKLEA